MAIFAQLASEAGGNDPAANEDHAAVSGHTVVVADGLTARVDTGCIHGVSWYARQLVNAVIGHAELEPQPALRAAIQDVAYRHRETCDLDHPGTPAAMIAIAMLTPSHLRYLVLGDVTLLLGTDGGPEVVTDRRVRHTALATRADADSHPIGSPEKNAALVRMKRAEIAVRNTPAGYWTATTDPSVVERCIAGSVERRKLRRFAVLTDGATRLVDLFHEFDWSALLDLLASSGPRELLRRTRDLENADRLGLKWPRNKLADDATAVYLEM
jgi:hypothetical protein